MELKYINREISQLATMEATNYISEYGLEKLKEFRYLKGLHEEKVKKLTIPDVSQLRELLIAYEIESKKPYKMSREIAEAKVKMIMKAINYTRSCKSDSEQLCEYCGLPLQEGVNLDYCKNDYCTRNDQHNCLQRSCVRIVILN